MESKKRDYKPVLMFGLILAIVFMSVGYASLAQRLTINGTADIGDASWNVKIASITYDSTNSTVSADDSTQGFNPAETVEGAGSTGAEFNVTLFEPGDTAVYTVIVENKGTINATLDSITDLTSVNAAQPSDITYTITPAANNATTLTPADTHTYTVTVTWSADATDIPAVTSKSATIYLDYVQAN